MADAGPDLHSSITCPGCTRRVAAARTRDLDPRSNRVWQFRVTQAATAPGCLLIVERCGYCRVDYVIVVRVTHADAGLSAVILGTTPIHTREEKIVRWSLEKIPGLQPTEREALMRVAKLLAETAA